MSSATFRVWRGDASGGQFQDYYYTSEKPLVDDPTHVGRNDRIYRFAIEGDTDPVIGRVSPRRSATASYSTSISAAVLRRRSVCTRATSSAYRLHARS